VSKSSKQKLPTPALVALVVVGVLFVYLVGYFVLVKPQSSKATSLKAEVLAKDKEVSDRRAAVAAASSVQPIKVADLFRLSKAMPDRVDMADLVLELNQVAADTGITFDSISPQLPTVSTGYEIVPIQVVFNGNFYQLSDLLYRLRGLVSVDHETLDARGRLFAVKSINFNEGADGFPNLQATLTVEAYVYGSFGAPAAPVPGSTDTTSTTTDTTATTTTSSTSAPPSGASAAPTGASQ
jgi:hypothetical protein